jgi:hypothetical protein
MKKNLIFLLCVFCMANLNAQNKIYWKTLNESDVNKNDIWANKFKPVDSKIFHLDEAALRNELTTAPSENNMQTAKSTTVITVPDAAGNLQRFNVYEYSLMQPKLATKYSSIKTYVGSGVDDASATIHFSITSSGFDAVVTSTGKQTLYINPLDHKSGVYAVGSRNENDVPNGFKCSIDESILKHDPSTAKASSFTGNADDGKLRKYRLALCVNGEFSRFFLDGTEADSAEMKEKVMNVLITILEKADAVYERDFGVRMIYVNNEDTLIYLNPATDPWPTRSGSSWNNKTQTAIDARIGSSNYDIGHLLGKVPTVNDNNGNAGCIGCVCNDAQKGSGFTAYNNPSLTDYMVIDYWTHEMGHQFGANHTFTFSVEGTDAQIEPGSGSTIMGYAGITGSTDVQAHSDDLFAVVSIAQNTTYIKSASGSCAVVISTGNTAPVVKAGSNKTIPKSTPFALTGTATDVDAADVLSYIWEQVDIYQNTSNTLPRPKSKSGPIFRTYDYSNSTVRYFPSMQHILDGSLGWKWEALPSVSRTLSFRFTARDNHTGGGNNKSASVLITVDSTAGPFKITTQNKSNAETWHGNETKTITWDVNNTDITPVNCASVNILLSTDGGITYPTTLAFKTPNDGTQDIIVPNLSTTKARIKIEAAGNIFFTINDTSFAIQSVLPVSWLSFTAQKLNNLSVSVKWSTTNEYNNKSYEVQRSRDGANFSSIAQVSAGNDPTKVEQYNYTDLKAPAGANYYRIKQTDANGNSSYSAIAKVILSDDLLTWSIQPNPVKTAASFYTRRNMTNVSINIYMSSGKNVYSTQRSTISAGEQIVIPVSNLAKGIYFVKVKSNEGSRTEKLVVE